MVGVAMAGTAQSAPRLAGMSAARTAAYVDCFDQHFGRLAGYCATMVGDRHAGQEIAQEAFARLFAKWVGVRDPKAYVYLVATNIAREQWRRDGYQQRAYGDVVRRSQTVADPPDVELRDLVDRLPDRQRRAVLLRYYADLPVTEVAALMTLPDGTVKRLLHEARGALGLALGDDR